MHFSSSVIGELGNIFLKRWSNIWRSMILFRPLHIGKRKSLCRCPIRIGRRQDIIKEMREMKERREDKRKCRREKLNLDRKWVLGCQFLGVRWKAPMYLAIYGCLSSQFSLSRTKINLLSTVSIIQKIRLDYILKHICSNCL